MVALRCGKIMMAPSTRKAGLEKMQSSTSLGDRVRRVRHSYWGNRDKVWT
jgi:hypothetical protein